MSDTLLLNTNGMPKGLLNWKEAISMLLKGKAYVVEEYNDWEVNSPSVTIKVPSVLMLVKYVVFRQPVKFSRANIYARDKYQCQYCGKKAGKNKPLDIKDLTFDHVLPRSRGGDTSWENITTACIDCNLSKDNNTPKEAGMPLLNKPVKPETVDNVIIELSRKSIPDAWRDYLYWTQELEN